MIRILKNIPSNEACKTSNHLDCQENTITLGVKACFYLYTQGLNHFLEIFEDVQEIHTALTIMSQDL